MLPIRNRAMSQQSLGFEQALSGQGLGEDEDWIIRLGFLIHDCARLRRLVLDEKFKPLHITRSQAWLLAYLSRSDGAPQSALAEQMSLGNVALGRLIDRLETRGLLERRTEPTDRRVNNIYLTQAGKKVIVQMRRLTLEANESILRDIEFADVKETAQLLTLLCSNLKEMRGS